MFALVFGIIVGALCLFDIPFLLLWPSIRHRPLTASIDLIGLASVGIAVGTTVGLHLAGIPITQGTVLTCYGVLLAVGVARFAMTRPGAGTAWLAGAADGWLLLGIVTAGLLALPVTNLAGIDTYKWQDLASAVRVERAIPWLVHPLSLLGFTPRAYPSAQPLLLATVQIAGGLGVHAGYYLVSLFCIVVALSAARRLGGVLGMTDPQAALVACLYVLSPVFMRYAHWATGRGLFLAFLPLFVASVLESGTRDGCVRAGLSAFVLVLCHKAGLVSVVVLPVLLLGGRWMPAARPVAAGMGAAAMALGLLLAPNRLLPRPLGHLVGAGWFAATRYVWMLPLAAWVPLREDTWRTQRRVRQVGFALVVLLPVVFHPQIYGAMLVLPLVVILATSGLVAVNRTWTAATHRLLRLGVLLSVLGALAIVTDRGLQAATPEVRRAAALLERYDPRGPYRVFAPGIARRQIQGYVSGCPRFSVRLPRHKQLALPAPPALAGLPRRVVADWIRYARNLLAIDNPEVAWYGATPRHYFVVIDGQGRCPANAERILADGPVAIYAPRGQAPPSSGDNGTAGRSERR